MRSVSRSTRSSMACEASLRSWWRSLTSPHCELRIVTIPTPAFSVDIFVVLCFYSFTFTNRRRSIRLLMPHREVNFELDSASVSDCAATNASVAAKAIQRIVGGYDLRGGFRRLCLKASWFDVILVVYFAGFLRQYFWTVSSEPEAPLYSDLDEARANCEHVSR